MSSCASARLFLSVRLVRRLTSSRSSSPPSFLCSRPKTGGKLLVLFRFTYHHSASISDCTSSDIILLPVTAKSSLPMSLSGQSALARSPPPSKRRRCTHRSGSTSTEPYPPPSRIARGSSTAEASLPVPLASLVTTYLTSFTLDFL